MNISNDVESVAKIAALSRGLVFIFQVVFNLIPDHQADAFQGVANASIPKDGILNKLVFYSLHGYHKWDARYFVFIADHGYTTAEHFAFFPLYPFLLKTLSGIVKTIFPLCTVSSILITGACINLFCFVGGSVYLYKLTKTMYGKEIAFISGVIFAFNPASIFFSALYTESLFSLCSFAGLYYVVNNEFMTSTVLFALAATTRSNGVVTIGFIWYYLFNLMVHEIIHLQNPKYIAPVTQFILKSIVSTVIVFSPFVLFNFYGYIKFCTTENAPAWCNTDLPLIYKHVQTSHWGLGLFEYYTFRKLPNIILAVPIVLITCVFSLQYIANNNCLYLELEKEKCWYCTRHGKLFKKYFNGPIFVFLCYTLFLMLFGVCFMHVEVITRMIFSSSPFPYWAMSFVIYQDTKIRFRNPTYKQYYNCLSNLSKLIIFYCLLYLVLGTFLHVNFLPWT